MTFLQQQLDLLEQQRESWKVLHDEAMSCRDVEDLAAFLLMFLQRLRRSSEEWAKSVEDGSVAFSWQQSEEHCLCYRRWRALAHGAMELVAQLEEEGYEVEGAQRLQAAHGDVSLMALDFERTRAAIASLDDGKRIPSGQAMDEIRDSLQP